MQRALYHNPKVLILDEATSALDNLTEQTVMEEVKNIGKDLTIIMIAHRLNTVKNCDNIFLLEKGELKQQGTFNELIKNSDYFSTEKIINKRYFMKYLIFIFKHRFRKNSLNNILKCKKIRQTYIIDLSGPFLYFLGKILYFFIRSKKVVFISCDGLDFLKRESNSINFWMGGTSEKIIEKYRKFENNFVAASTIFTDSSKILTFYPISIIKDKFNSDFKFVYISENKKITNIKSLKIWENIKIKF